MNIYLDYKKRRKNIRKTKKEEDEKRIRRKNKERKI